MLKNKKGFTLVELMMVVVILGVLTIMAIPTFNGYTLKSEKNVCASNRKMIEEAAVKAAAMGRVLQVPKGVVYFCPPLYIMQSDGTKIYREETKAYSEEYFSDMFAELPCCPKGGLYYYWCTDENKNKVQCSKCGF